MSSRGLHAQARIQKEVKSQKGQELVCIRFYGHDRSRRIDRSSSEKVLSGEFDKLLLMFVFDYIVLLLLYEGPTQTMLLTLSN